MAKIKTVSGCRDCKKCTNSKAANLGRNTGRATAVLLTGGLSEVGMMTRKKCRACGHQLSLHRGAEAQTVQPAVTVAQQPSTNATSNPLAKLRDLAELHQAGVLTDEEFATHKAKLLGEIHK